MIPTASAGANRPVTTREIWAWILYDWANSAYYTLLITFYVGYLKNVVPDQAVAQQIWGYGISGSMMLGAILSPIVGAMADAHASKHKWLAGTALTGALAAALTCLGGPGQVWLLVVPFLVANVCFELSLVFYDGFLPEIAKGRSLDQVSSWGYMAGYLGGGLALLLALVLFQYATQLGLSETLVVRGNLLMMGVWWGVFSLPAIVLLRDRETPRAPRQTLLQAGSQAFGEVRSTLGRVRQFRVLAIFLAGFLIYNDGIQTVINQASRFAQDALHMGTGELAGVILLIQFVAFPGAMAVGYLAKRWGQKQTLLLCLAIWTSLIGCAYFVKEKWEFWILSVLVALVLGGTQSVSRAIMGTMTPRQHTAEFFGFFSFAGKATSTFGPLIYTQVMLNTGSAHLAILSLLVFFFLGTLIIAPLDIASGRELARHEDEREARAALPQDLPTSKS